MTRSPSTPAARRSSPRRSSRPSPTTPTCTTWCAPAARPSDGARRSSRSCSCARAPRATEDDLLAEAATHVARYKLPEGVPLPRRDRALTRRQGRLPVGQGAGRARRVIRSTSRRVSATMPWRTDGRCHWRRKGGLMRDSSGDDLVHHRGPRRRSPRRLSAGRAPLSIERARPRAPARCSEGGERRAQAPEPLAPREASAAAAHPQGRAGRDPGSAPGRKPPGSSGSARTHDPSRADGSWRVTRVRGARGPGPAARRAPGRSSRRAGRSRRRGACSAR